MLSVAEIMSRDLITLGPNASLADASKVMTEHNIHHIPIVEDEGTLVGLVSHRDVLSAQDSSLLGESAEARKDDYVAVSSVMIKDVHATDEHASLRGTALHMKQHKMGCLPVLRDGKLVGIITESDFVTIAITLMDQLEAAEPEEDFGGSDDGDF